MSLHKNAVKICFGGLERSCQLYNLLPPPSQKRIYVHIFVRYTQKTQKQFEGVEVIFLKGNNVFVSFFEEIFPLVIFFWKKKNEAIYTARLS